MMTLNPIVERAVAAPTRSIAMMSGGRIFGIAAALLLPAGATRAEPPPTPGITAALSPSGAVVGATPVALGGQAGAGDFVVRSSTFPDGSVHEFTVKADEGGAERVENA